MSEIKLWFIVYVVLNFLMLAWMIYRDLRNFKRLDEDKYLVRRLEEEQKEVRDLKLRLYELQKIIQQATTAPKHEGGE